eukprot:scaffold57906_cov43-Phaeocystis_antarctica.AAC.2
MVLLDALVGGRVKGAHRYGQRRGGGRVDVRVEEREVVPHDRGVRRPVGRREDHRVDVPASALLLEGLVIHRPVAAPWPVGLRDVGRAEAGHDHLLAPTLAPTRSQATTTCAGSGMPLVCSSLLSSKSSQLPIECPASTGASTSKIAAAYLVRVTLRVTVGVTVRVRVTVTVKVRVQVRVRVSSAAAYRCSSVSLGSARRPSRPGSSSASSSPPLSRQCSTNGLSTVVRKPRPVQTLSELPALWKQTMRNLGASTFFHFGNHRLSSASVTGGSIGPAAAVAGCVPTSGSWPPFSKYSRTVVSSHRLIFSKTISTSSARQSAWMSSSSSKVSGMETGDRLGTGGGQRVLISPACVVRARDDELGRDDATTVCRLVKKDPKRDVSCAASFSRHRPFTPACSSPDQLAAYLKSPIRRPATARWRCSTNSICTYTQISEDPLRNTNSPRRRPKSAARRTKGEVGVQPSPLWRGRLRCLRSSCA